MLGQQHEGGIGEIHREIAVLPHQLPHGGHVVFVQGEEYQGTAPDEDMLLEEGDRILFCGDSPNDEPMFQYFPYTAGVKNIINFAENMTYLPAFVATQSGGEGFTEIVEVILKLRNK